MTQFSLTSKIAALFCAAMAFAPCAFAVIGQASRIIA